MLFRSDGWQTDRGMIYMVFGPPRIVNRSLSTETWSYDNGTGNDLNFIFRKNKNELSENDFVLDRNIMYKADWYKAVDFWRNGRIGLSN